MGRRELMNESVKRKRSLKTALCMGLIRLFRPHPSPSGTARDLGEAIRAAGTSRRRGAVLRSIDRFVDLACGLKQRCTPNMPARKILRSIHEGARDLARDLALTDAYLTSRRQRKKVEMLFAHLKRILKLDRLRLRGPNGAKDEFLLAATAQNLRKLAKLIPIPQPAPA